jgi:hypothetical protein
MTITAGYAEKIVLIPPPHGIRGNRFTTTTSTPPEPGHAS